MRIMPMQSGQQITGMEYDQQHCKLQAFACIASFVPLFCLMVVHDAT